MLNGIYDAIKGYLTSRKTLNNEKQTHDRANKCLKKTYVHAISLQKGHTSKAKSTYYRFLHGNSIFWGQKSHR